MQMQINPHFLFNTLNTIASLTRTNPNKARDLGDDLRVVVEGRRLDDGEAMVGINVDDLPVDPRLAERGWCRWGSSTSS